MATNWTEYNKKRAEKRKYMSKEEKAKESMDQKRYKLMCHLEEWARVTAEIRMRTRQ